jgi:hypothetical protein
VVNLALPGMNTVDHAAQLAGEGMAYGPDVVLVGYVLNDSEDSQAAEARRAADWSQPPRAPGLLDRSALVRMIRGRLWATAENRRRISGYKSMYADSAPGWVAARQALKKMGALCRERGVPMVVAIFPLFGNPMDDRYPFPEIHAKVAEAASEAGAKVVDLLPAYRGLRWELLVVDGVDDEHPNEIAHRIAAGVILHTLDGVVPWTAGTQVPPPLAAGSASSWRWSSWCGSCPSWPRTAWPPTSCDTRRPRATSSTSPGTRTSPRGSIRTRRCGSGSRRAASGWPAPPASASRCW